MTLGKDELFLQGICNYITSGKLAEDYLKAKQNDAAQAKNLNAVLSDVDKRISDAFKAVNSLKSELGTEVWVQSKIDQDTYNMTGYLGDKFFIVSKDGELKEYGFPLYRDVPPYDALGGDIPREIIATESFVTEEIESAKSWVAEEISKVHIADVNDYIDENGVVRLKITFSREGEDEDKVLDIPLDAVFSGVDKLLAEKANTADVNALIDEAKGELDDKKLDKETAEWGKIKGNAVPGIADNKLIVKGKEDGVTGYVEAKTIVPFTYNGDPYYAFFNGTNISFARNYKDGTYGSLAKFYLPSAYTPSSAQSNEILATREYADNVAKSEAIAKTDEVSNRIDNLEGILVKKTVDDSVAYEKTVPEASAQKAILSSVGGASRVVDIEVMRKQASVSIDDPYINIGTLEAGDYSIELSLVKQTGEGDISEINYMIATSESGEEYYFDFDGLDGSFTLPQKCTCFYNFNSISAEITELVYDVTVKKLNVLQSAPVTAIVSEGKNLIDDVAFLEDNGFVKQSDGFWYGKNLSKTIFENTELKKGAISVSYFGYQEPNDMRYFTFVVRYTDGEIAYLGTIPLYTTAFKVTSFTTNPEKIVKSIGVSYGTVGYFYIKDFMINWGAPIEYKPCFKKTYEIPKAVVNDADWGISVDDAVNTYSFDNKEYSKYAKVKIYDGAEDWMLSSATSGRLFYENDPLASPNSSIICNKFTFDENLDATIRNNAFISGTGRLNITADGYNTVAEWKSQLARWKDEGAPFTVVYKLIAPEIVPITDESYTDYKFIEVEGGGTVRFENENKMAVPSKITFAEV